MKGFVLKGHVCYSKSKNERIIPGMVDLHIHAPQYVFRVVCMDQHGIRAQYTAGKQTTI